MRKEKKQRPEEATHGRTQLPTIAISSVTQISSEYSPYLLDRSVKEKK